MGIFQTVLGVDTVALPGPQEPARPEGPKAHPVLPPQSTVDKLIKKTNLALVVGTNSWREQFIEAITVSAGECRE